MPIEAAATGMEHGALEAATGVNAEHVLVIGAGVGLAVIAGIAAARYLYRRLFKDPW